MQDLAGLVQGAQNTPREPAYAWRYAVEAAVEASFFAHPGLAYREAVKALSEVLQSRLGSTDAVTEMALLRALVLLAELSEALQGEALLTEPSVQRFLAYAASRPAEWTAPLLPARLAVQTLAHHRPSLANQLKWWARLIQQPSAVFSGVFQAPRRGLLATRLIVLAALLLSEILQVLVVACVVVGPFSLLAHKLGVTKDVLLPAARGLFVFLAGAVAVLRVLAWQRSPTKAAARGVLLWRLPSLIGQGISGLYRERRQLVQTYLGSMADRLAMLAIVVGFLVVISALVLPLVKPKKEPSSCSDTEVVQIGKQIRARFPALLETAAPDLQKLRRELRASLDRLREANRDYRCGWEQESGWLLVEDRTADILAKLDPRLVPTPPAGRLPMLGRSDMRALEEILAVKPVREPPPGFMGSLAAFQLSWQEGAAVERLQEMESRLLAERRSGYGLPALGNQAAVERVAPAAIARATAALGKIEASLATHGAALESLKQRYQKGAFWGASGAVALGALLLLLRAVSARVHDQRVLAKVDRVTVVPELCALALSPRHSERIRLRALQRLDQLEAVGPKDLQQVEQAVGVLLASKDSTERNLGIYAAGLARAISNRLRHRFAEDFRQPPKVGQGARA